MAVHVGCCGFPVERKRYCERFSLVEVQQSFYQPPRPETAMRWRESAPPSFAFTLKAWQLITHEPQSPTYGKAKLFIAADRASCYGSFRPTEEVHDAWAATLSSARVMRALCVVFQCSASFTPTEEHIADMRRFFSSIERDHLMLVWEPRGAWEDEVIAPLCRDLELIHCTDPFVRQPVTTEPTYFRLHGIGGYRYRYSADDLERLRAMCLPRGEVYCLFNNVWMWESAQEFQQLLLRHSLAS